MKHKILIIDDDRDVLQMLRDFFEILRYQVFIAVSGQEGIERLDINPDIILLDVNMPEMDGFEVCKKIRNQVDVPILFLTAKTEERERIQGLMVGGDDYILKPFSIEELQARVEAHLRREERGAFKKNVRNVDGLQFDYDKQTIELNGMAEKFTKTEFEILELFIEYRGQTFDKERIYEKLWGFDKDGDSAIITEHVRRIRGKIKKLYVNNNVEPKDVIQTVWGVGYRWNI